MDGGGSAEVSSSKWLSSRNQITKRLILPRPAACFRNPSTVAIIHKDWIIAVIGRRLEYLDLNTLQWYYRSYQLS
jgi:hypothetical protein